MLWFLKLCIHGTILPKIFKLERRSHVLGSRDFPNYAILNHHAVPGRSVGSTTVREGPAKCRTKSPAASDAAALHSSATLESMTPHNWRVSHFVFWQSAFHVSNLAARTLFALSSFWTCHTAVCPVQHTRCWQGPRCNLQISANSFNTLSAQPGRLATKACGCWSILS